MKQNHLVAQHECQTSTKYELGEEELNSVLSSWNTSLHQLRSVPEENCDFVLEDESIVQQVTELVQFSYVLDVVETGSPVVSISNGLLKLMNCEREHVLWKRWDRFFGTHDLETVAEALRSRRTVCSKLTLSKHSASRSVVGCFVPIFDHNNHITKYVACFATDLSDDDEQRSNFERKVKNLLRACFVTDGRLAEMPIVRVTEGFIKLTGFGHADIFRRSILALCGTGSTKSSIKTLLDHRKSCSIAKTSILLYKKTGAPFFSVLLSFPVFVTGVESVNTAELLMIIIDVTAQRPETLNDYILGRTIGAGSSGAVRIAKTNTNDEIVAVKIVDASRFRSISEIELVEDEIRALSSVKHENIINLHEVIFKNHVFYFVMDFAAGGSLAQYLRSKRGHCLEEEEARTVFTQVVSAVSYCHRKRVVHRDLKPENILRDTTGKIQVADFGLSAIVAPFGNLTTQCGTPEFVAPELLSTNAYDGALADIWSLGVILYEVLTGNAPFSARSKSELFSQIQNGGYQPLPEDLSVPCRDLVSKMLTKDPLSRITMDEILTHPWLNQSHSMESKCTEDEVSMKGGIGVHESAKLTLGDWDDDDDAISNAIRSGDYSRSPSIVIVRNHASISNKELSEELEELRMHESDRRQMEEPKNEKKGTKHHRIMPFFRNRDSGAKKSTSTKSNKRNSKR